MNTLVFRGDNRGLIVYDKNTTRPVVVTALGVVPDNFTDIEPVFESPGWDGEKWVNDENIVNNIQGITENQSL